MTCSSQVERPKWDRSESGRNGPNWDAKGVRDPLPQEMAASMDDEAVFWPVLYKLSIASAVSHGLLARYQIIVLELK